MWSLIGDVEIFDIYLIFELEDDLQSHFLSDTRYRREEFFIPIIDGSQKRNDPESEDVDSRLSSDAAYLEETLEDFFFFTILESEKRLRNIGDVVMERE